MKRILLSFLLTFLMIPLAHAQAGFSDVDETYSKAIRYLRNKEVIQGYHNGTYKPEKPITRAEFIKMLITNQADHEKTSNNHRTYPYNDVPHNAWYANSVQRAWEIGLLNNNKELHPNAPITRVEGTKLILNMLGLPTPRIISEEDWPLNFYDVRHNMWYAPTVMYGTQYNIIKPLDPNGNYFRPLKPLTRGNAAQIVYNMEVYLLGTQIFDGAAELEGALIDAGLKNDIPKLNILADVWNQIHSNHFNPANLEGVSDDELIYDAIKGLVDGLNDPYSTFLDPPETETFDDFLEGEFGGIGAEISEEPQGVIIRSLLVDSPAESSGLMPNDIIVNVDGTDVRGESARAIVQLIRGEIGTNVTVTIERNNREIDFTITRDTIQIGYVKGELLGDAIYVDINLFTAMSFIDFTQTVQPLIEENPDFKGFILDVRNNPGGYLSSVKSILGHFIPRGHTMLYMKKGPRNAQLHVSEGKGEWEDYPVVVLINGESASASEILAMTLFERNNAVLVGQTTFGKGTVQEVIDYNDGSTLKLTIAEWRSLNFHSLNNIGLDPQVYADLTTEDIMAKRDPQLDAALEEFDKAVERWEAAKTE